MGSVRANQHEFVLLKLRGGLTKFPKSDCELMAENYNSARCTMDFNIVGHTL